MAQPRSRAVPLAKRRCPRSGGAVAMVFLAPALATLVLTRLAPAVDTFIASLRDGGAWTLANYADLGATTFREAVITTVVFNAIINPAQVLVAYALAVVLSQRLPAVGLWRTLIFLPMAVPPAVSTVVWGIWFRPGDGIVNSLLGVVGSPGQALYVIMVIASWIGVGYWMMFLIAGIKNVPIELVEAAAIDGAGWWRRLITIVTPMVRRQLSFVLVAATVANFLLFVPVQVLTRGGPAGSTNLVMYEAYTQAFVFNNPGPAFAQITVLVVLVAVIVAVQFRLMSGPREQARHAS
ncbi:MAG: sugar ABC transporter permease [Acidimicrobiia bacterium]|nr:sugar ABC transporter permease [Acidimicrobiia bacterium]